MIDINDILNDLGYNEVDQEGDVVNKIVGVADITGIVDAGHSDDVTSTMIRYKTDAGNFVNAISNSKSIAAVANEIKLLWAIGKKPLVTMIVDAKTGCKLQSLAVIVNKPS